MTYLPLLCIAFSAGGGCNCWGGGALKRVIIAVLIRNSSVGKLNKAVLFCCDNTWIYMASALSTSVDKTEDDIQCPFEMLTNLDNVNTFLLTTKCNMLSILTLKTLYSSVKKTLITPNSKSKRPFELFQKVKSFVLLLGIKPVSVKDCYCCVWGIF